MTGRKNRSHPNWPLRWSLLTIVAVIVGSLLLSTVWTVTSLHLGKTNPVIWSNALLNRLFEVFFAFWFFVVGACVGSFLNVVAWRMPRGMPITGFSRCPYCRVGIRGPDNMPILGWIKLRGRCRVCRLPISPRYPIFELLAGLVFLFLFFAEIMSQGRNLPLAPGSRLIYANFFGQIEWDIVLRAFVHLWLLTLLLAGCLIRLDHQSIPVRLIVFGLLSWLSLHVLWPDLIVVPWTSAQYSMSSRVATRFQAVATLLCGGTLAIAIGTAVLPWIRFLGETSSPDGELSPDSVYPPHMHVRLRKSRSICDISWLGMLAIAGAGVGWQATFSVMLILSGLVGILWVVKRIKGWRISLDPSAWVWSAVLLQISFWSQINYFFVALVTAIF